MATTRSNSSPDRFPDRRFASRPPVCSDATFSRFYRSTPYIADAPRAPQTSVSREPDRRQLAGQLLSARAALRGAEQAYQRGEDGKSKIDAAHARVAQIQQRLAETTEHHESTRHHLQQ